MRSKKYQRQVFFGRLDFFLPIFKFFFFSFLLSFIEGEVFEKVPPWTKKSPLKENGRIIRGLKRRAKSLKTSDFLQQKIYLAYKKYPYGLSMNIRYGQNCKKGYVVWTNLCRKDIQDGQNKNGYTCYPFLERRMCLFLRKGIYGISLRKKKNRSRIWDRPKFGLLRHQWEEPGSTTSFSGLISHPSLRTNGIFHPLQLSSNREKIKDLSPVFHGQQALFAETLFLK